MKSRDCKKALSQASFFKKKYSVDTSITDL